MRLAGMPTIESLSKMEEVSAEWLVKELQVDTVLVLDCRSQQDFHSGHIHGSMNVNLPPLLQRRLKNGNLSVSTAVQGNHMKEKFSSECAYKSIVMCEYSRYDINANNSNLLTLLYNKLVKDQHTVKILSGNAMFPTNVHLTHAHVN